MHKLKLIVQRRKRCWQLWNSQTKTGQEQPFTHTLRCLEILLHGKDQNSTRMKEKPGHARTNLPPLSVYPPFSSSSPHKSRKLLIWSFQLFPSKWQKSVPFQSPLLRDRATHKNTHTHTHSKDPITCVWSFPHHLKWTGYFKGLTQLFILSVPFI